MQRYFAKNNNPNSITLSSQDYHHIKNVMKLKKGDQIEVVVNNIVYLCDIKEDYQIKTREKINSREKDSPEIVLAVSLIKEQKQDLVLQKVTELGVDKIIPISLSRCVVKLDEDRFNKKKQRWESICKEASEQSKRNIIPEITQVKKLKDLIELDYPLKMVLDTSPTAPTIKNVLHNNELCAKIIIVIGPEGGLTPEEIDILNQNGYQSVSLGPNILRAETAAITVLSMINYHYLR